MSNETGRIPGTIYPTENGDFVYVPREMVRAVSAIVAELHRAMQKFPNNQIFRSRHEGYGVLLEEVDELWDAIKSNNHGAGKSQDVAEAIQVGAMALHYIKDFGGGDGSV